MANIRPRKDKNGNIISYEIRVFKGRDSNGKQLKPYTMTWKPAENMTVRQIDKELKRQEVAFEEKCKQGLTGDGRQRFDEYANYVLKLKEKSGEHRHNTVARNRELLRRCNEHLGHMKVEDIRPVHLNTFYDNIGKEGGRLNSSKAKLLDEIDLRAEIKAKGFTSLEKFSKDSGFSLSCLRELLKGNQINLKSAEKIVTALETPVKMIFEVIIDNTPLSPKTVREHHILCQTILGHAVKEGLIINNPAERATPPKCEKHKAEFFEADDVADIIQAAENIPLKWRTIIHLMIATGGRRGEVLGLKWENVDFTFNRIYIDTCVYYRSDVGIFTDKPKTESSIRWIKLPPATMEMLRQYKTEYYEPLKQSVGSKWNETSFVFIKDTKDYGKPQHPDTVSGYCDRFANKYGLPKINPHKFRHTAASLLYFAGMDSISIAGHLGHASPVTTQNLYAHVIAESQSKIADCMGEILFQSQNKRKDIKEQTV